MSLYHTSVMSNIIDYVNDEPLAKKGFQIYDLGTIIDTKHGKIMLEEYDPQERKYSVKKLGKSGNIWEKVDVKVKEETIYECIENDDWSIHQLNEESYEPNYREKYFSTVDNVLNVYKQFIDDEDFNLINNFNDMFNNTYHLITNKEDLPLKETEKGEKYYDLSVLKNAYDDIWDYGFNEKSNLYLNGNRFNYKAAIEIADASVKILDRNKKRSLFSDDYDLE